MIAGAGFGASKALEDILAEQMVRAQMAQREQQAQAEMEMRRQQLAESARQADVDAGQRQQQIDLQAGDRRERRNIQGVRRMLGEAVTQRQGPMTPDDRRGLAALQIEAGDDPTLLNEPKPERDPIADHEARARIDARYRKPERDPIADHEAKLRLDAKYKTGQGTGPSSYVLEQSEDVIRKINDLIGDPNDPNSTSRINRRTAGVGGSFLSRVPWQTEARDVNAELQSLAANLAFSQLQKMRDASKTGGALGQVALQELELLKNAEASIRQDQSPENLTRQLNLIRASEMRFRNTAGADGGPPQAQPGGGADLIYDPVTKTLKPRGGE